MEKIRLDNIVPNSWNPNLPTERELERIKTSLMNEGISKGSPILVRRLDSDKYEIVDGEQKYNLIKEDNSLIGSRNYLILGEEVVVEEDMSDRQAMITTLQLDRSKGQLRGCRYGEFLIRLYEEEGLTQGEIANDVLGDVGRTWVSRKINVTKHIPKALRSRFDNLIRKEIVSSTSLEEFYDNEASEDEIREVLDKLESSVKSKSSRQIRNMILKIRGKSKWRVPSYQELSHELQDTEVEGSQIDSLVEDINELRLSVRKLVNPFEDTTDVDKYVENRKNKMDGILNTFAQKLIKAKKELQKRRVK